MKWIDATDLDYRTLNEKLRQTNEDCTIDGCCGQRFVAAGMSDKTLTINGIPGFTPSIKNSWVRKTAWLNKSSQ